MNVLRISNSFLVHNLTSRSPTSKEENSIVERANKEVLRHLRAIIFDKRFVAKWGKHDLPMVQRIFNTDVKQSTGVSPAQLLFGDALHLDHQIFVARAPNGGDTGQPRRLS